MNGITRTVSSILAAVMCVACFASCSAKKESRWHKETQRDLADLKGAKIAAQAATFHADALSQIEDVQSST